MKQMVIILALLLMAASAYGAVTTVQAGISSSGESGFVVRAKVSGGGFTGQIFSGVCVTVYWETAAGLTLGSAASAYSVAADGAIETDGIFSYQKFASTPNVNITMADGDEIELFSVTVSGTGPAVFELKNPPAAANGDWYFEVGGLDYTNTSSPFYSASTELPLPVTLVCFNGSVSATEGGVVLEWKTASEVNNFGFTVQRKSSLDAEYADIPGSFIEGKGTTVEAQRYSYVDKSIAAAGTYAYRLKQQDLDGTLHYSQSVLVSMTLADVAETSPVEFGLMQNWPNPFNPLTNIRYSVGELGSRQQAVGSRWMKLAVYDLLGREVAVLVDEVKEPGSYSVTWNAEGMASGTYVYRLTAGEKTDTRRMVLLK